jgi:hypothetical protein
LSSSLPRFLLPYHILLSSSNSSAGPVGQRPPRLRDPKGARRLRARRQVQARKGPIEKAEHSSVNAVVTASTLCFLGRGGLSPIRFVRSGS